MSIGRISFQNGNGYYYSCTASLIHRDYILTNAHCIFHDHKDENGKTIKKEVLVIIGKKSLTFFPSLYDNKYLDKASWKALYYPKQYENVENNYQEQDWAIIKLDKALGDAFGWIGLVDRSYQNYPKKEKVNLVGYSGDLYSKTAGAHYNCELKELYTIILADKLFMIVTVQKVLQAQEYIRQLAQVLTPRHLLLLFIMLLLC